MIRAAKTLESGDDAFGRYRGGHVLNGGGTDRIWVAHARFRGGNDSISNSNGSNGDGT